ncbi:N-acetyltransferase [Flavobacterium sp. LS1P28]|uniref:GNAT family N-acetyltransferase n=1 Tax=unclassified Flavobacterium TaxID=196869 RepID=UPI000F8237ED|nr:MULTISPECIES: GNAT family protein [unclassified Flavobacterium]RTY82499.1 N-acetyltransferase [Flavobacterium sp. LS1P28]RTY84894.1 N-acetyltransferase [Flavobacterium sp. ZB4P23]RTY94542.1 N-acetyltransferase [Flavobacterium sp. GSN2]
MLAINFSPFPDLETERLLLRRVNTNDIKEIFALRSNPETMKYIPRPLVKTNEDALEHIAMIDTKIEANEGINWAITLKDNPKLIGVIGHYRIKPEHYRAEIGYMLLPEYHGKGIVSEAVKEAVNYGFQIMKLHSIEAMIDPDNDASAKVLEKNGFVREGHLKENEFFDGRFFDTLIYSLLNKY